MSGALIGGVASGIGSLISGIMGSNSSSKAAEEQAQSAANSLNWIKQVYGNTASNLNPYITTGTNALNTLSGFYGLGSTANQNGAQAGYQSYMNTPYYTFPLAQSNLATERSLAASGLTNSGGALRDLSSLNSGYASSGLSNYLSGLSGLSTSGQNAATSLGNIGVGTGSQISAANTQYGNANAAGTIGSTNALSSGVSGVTSALTNTNFLNSLSSLLGGSSYGSSNNTYNGLSSGTAAGTWGSGSNTGG